ncbi:MAG: hypothetical protein K9K87_09275 [Desulfotignum sp.]|nr:hypothetical protein [Desulfotignum sp.]
MWSTGFIAAKYALRYIEPFYLLFTRSAITAAVFLLLYLAFRVPALTLRQARQQMVTGFLIHGTYLGGVFAAIAVTVVGVYLVVKTPNQ